MDSELPSDLRITDRHIIQKVDAEREKRGDATGTKTACRLIVERLAQLELIEHNGRTAEQQPSSPS